MVFSTISAYLDPANWQQQSNYESGNNASFPPPQQSIVPPPPPPMQPHGAGGAGSVRPGSMADRARMANIPMPETAQKCPRCESTNTKFCYFNNYSLSQPRHFCKTCRRYWTRGGALRNVPVGGGCRRNKRSSNKASSSTTSKSDPAHSETVSGSTSSTLPSNTCGTAATSILGGLASQFPQLRFMAPMSHLNDHYGGGELTNYSGISTLAGATGEMNHQAANSYNSYNLFGGSGGGVATVLSSGGGGLEQWRMQQLGNQFPNFLGGFDPTGATQGGLLYGNNNYQGGGFEVGSGGYAGSKFSNASVLSQIASSVKMEGSNNNIINKNNQEHDADDDTHESNLGRHFLGSSNSQWNTSATTAWTDLSGFSSSSTSNAL